MQNWKKLIDSLPELGGLKLVAILVLEFKKTEKGDGTLYSTFYLNSKAESIINESGSDDIFESIYTVIISNIQKPLGKDLGYIIDPVIDHTINISKYNFLAGRSY